MDLNALYLLYGEEKYFIELELNKIKKEFGDKINGINYIQLDSSNIESIIENIETPTFGYNKKLIVIRDSQLFKKQAKGKKTEKDAKDKIENKLTNKISEYINENIDFIKETSIIVFVENEIDKNDLYATIEKYGKVVEFSKLKTLEIEKKIKSICNSYKVYIDEVTVKYFISVCGTNMQDLINEIRKQIEYAGENGTITKESIDKLGIKELDSVIFDLTDNLGKKNIKIALEILSNMLYEREPIQKILITLYNHFKKLYLTKIAVESNQNIAEMLDLKPNQIFLVNKYTMQSKYFTKKELKDILQELINLDYNSKIGKIDINTGLESVLCKYCS